MGGTGEKWKDLQAERTECTNTGNNRVAWLSVVEVQLHVESFQEMRLEDVKKDEFGLLTAKQWGVVVMLWANVWR